MEGRSIILGKYGDTYIPIKVSANGYIMVIGNDKGWYINLAALQAAHPTGQDGWYARTGTPDAMWLWDSDTSAWVDSGISGSVTTIDGKTGDVDGRINNVIFFGAGGNDSNDGKSYIQRKPTLASARTAVIALSPTNVNPCYICGYGAGIFSESYTTLDYVDLIAPGIILTGVLTVNHNTYIALREQRGNVTVASGKILRCNIMEFSSGTLTKTGKIRGQLGDKNYVSEIVFEA